ncbi:putative zinc finger protein 56 [Liparis tanakae]|uniref:Putative zinc finger protein 56 n=1 Tax=Liparis tanakae TaxID=230148 RepID=A0A4Z2HRQ4_9TELE|nr:putative zinc finger protein 56 [Liparis tanakae]
MCNTGAFWDVETSLFRLSPDMEEFVGGRHQQHDGVPSNTTQKFSLTGAICLKTQAAMANESMPPACNICKSFFTSEKTLLNHVHIVHTSVVSTKVCIITNPSALADTSVSPGVLGTAAQSANSRPIEVNQVMNGKLCVGQTYAGSLSTSAHADRPCATMCMASSAAAVKDGAQGPKNQSLIQHPAPIIVLADATDTSQAPAGSDAVAPPMPSIMALFKNDSHDVAMMKRMNAGWRSKTPHPCRQCGAILRQPSFIISHRYLHRGHRSHKCQCGRAFKHQLHLLRHCVRHAETVSYICVSCGETFTGAKLFAEHMRGKSRKNSFSGHSWKPPPAASSVADLISGLRWRRTWDRSSEEASLVSPVLTAVALGQVCAVQQPAFPEHVGSSVSYLGKRRAPYDKRDVSPTVRKVMAMSHMAVFMLPVAAGVCLHDGGSGSETVAEQNLVSIQDAVSQKKRMKASSVRAGYLFISILSTKRKLKFMLLSEPMLL